MGTNELPGACFTGTTVLKLLHQKGNGSDRTDGVHDSQIDQLSSLVMTRGLHRRTWCPLSVGGSLSNYRDLKKVVGVALCVNKTYT